MKPSQKFFKIPVIMYDALSLRHAMEQEEHIEEQLNMPLSSHAEVQYAVGHYYIKIEDVVGMSDTYTRDRTIAEVQETGFNATEVYLANDPPVVCPLTTQEFADRYDAHYLKLEKYLQGQLEKVQQLQQKRNWFFRWFNKIF